MTPGDIVACPEQDCELPAEITSSYLLRSTDGPVEHVTIQCLNSRHWFNMAADRLQEIREAAA